MVDQSPQGRQPDDLESYYVQSVYRPQRGPVQDASKSVPLESAQRTAILEAAIARYVIYGFRVVARTETSAELIKQKKFNNTLAFLLFAIAIFPVAFYMIYYWLQKDEAVHVEVTDQGQILTQRSP